MNCMVKTLEMLEFGWWEDTMTRGGKIPTTTKLVDGGRELERCRQVNGEFNPTRRIHRQLVCGDATAWGQGGLARFHCGLRERRRQGGHAEVNLMFVDVNKSHVNAKCEEKWVELPGGFAQFGRYAKLQRFTNSMMKAASGWEDDYARKLASDGFKRGAVAPTIFYHPETQVRVVVHGHEFTFAGPESASRMIESYLCEWWWCTGAQHPRQRKRSRCCVDVWDGQDTKRVTNIDRRCWKVRVQNNNPFNTFPHIVLKTVRSHLAVMLATHRQCSTVTCGRALNSPNVLADWPNHTHLQDSGLNEDSNTVSSAEDEPEDIQQQDVEMWNERTLNWLRFDRWEVQYTAKEVCAKMVNPTLGSEKRPRRQSGTWRVWEGDVGDTCVEKLWWKLTWTCTVA